MKTHIIGIFGPCDMKQAQKIAMRSLTSHNTTKHPKEKVNAILELPPTHDHPRLEKWIHDVKQFGGTCVITKRESDYKVQELCDVVYKLEVTSQGRFTRITIMKFHDLAI